MIPPSNSRPFGRVLTPLSEIDLARLIVRTGQLAAEAHHEQGWAAFAIGCDGRKRTTFFDGSACQVEGEVCLAQRQDGISSCIDAPARGSGLISQSITFKEAACEPVTGWYLLDNEGYLYRIPADLVTAVSYWPVAAVGVGRRYDLVRSGTWAALMCADPIAPPPNNSTGGSVWGGYTPSGESAVVVQAFKTLIGGLLTHLLTVPSVTVGTSKVTVSAHSGRWAGQLQTLASATDVSVTQQDRNAAYLTPGQEYRAVVYAAAAYGGTISLGIYKGLRAAAGAAVLPISPSPYSYVPLAELTVPFTGDPIVSVAVGTVVPINLSVARQLGAADPQASLGAFHGLVLRDADAPNPGVRGLSIDLPSAGSGVVSGAVRVAFGYPFAFEHLTEQIDTTAPYGLSSHTLEGSRDDYDMALVYGPARLGIEYAPYHINLQGPDLGNPGAWARLDTEGIEDHGANIIQLPNGEVALSQALTTGGTPVVPQMLQRFRVRPAPTEAPTVTLAQTAIPSYGLDPNIREAWWNWPIDEWTAGDLTVTSAYPWTHGRDVQVVVWQGVNVYYGWEQDPDAKVATIGEPVGATCPLTFATGGCPTRKVGQTCFLSYLGPRLVVQYGWTFTDADGIESALSPLSEPTTGYPGQEVVPLTATYDLTVGVPLGPAGTTERGVYRFAWDRAVYGYDPGAYPWTRLYGTPWSSISGRPGAVYDRMVGRLVTIPDNTTTEWLDDQTTIDFSGVRPPQPFIPAGSGITLDTRRRVYVLPPMNL